MVPSRSGSCSEGPCIVPFRPRSEAVNPIGSGDCLLAGLVDGWLAGLDPKAFIRHAVACAVANALVWDAGAIDRERVLRVQDQIRVEQADNGRFSSWA